MSLDCESDSLQETYFLWHAATKFAARLFAGQCRKFSCFVPEHFLVRSGTTEIAVERFHLLNRFGMS